MRCFLSLSLLIFLSAALLRAQSAPPADAHLGKGFQLLEDDRYQEAAREFQEALSVAPQMTRARYQLAICLFALGERERARAEFERVDRERGGDPQAAYFLGRIDLAGGANQRSIAHLRPIASSPPFPDTAFYLGCAYLALRDTAAAIHWLKEAEATNPRDFRVHYRLARAYQAAAQKEDAEREYLLSTQAREHYDEAARDYTLCEKALETQNAGDAHTVCDRIFDRNDPDKLTLLGMVYGRHGRYEDSLPPLQAAARLDPDSFEIFHNLGVSYFRLRRYSDAEAQLSRSIALRPDYFGSNALLGATLYLLKRDEEAYRVLDHAHQLNPSSEDTATLLFQEAMLLGQRNFQGRNYEDAVRYWRKAAGIRPDDAAVRERIAGAMALAAEERH